MQSELVELVLSKHPQISVPTFLEIDMKSELELPYINGCGSSTGISSEAPSTIDGICILAACIIHDARYYRGETLSDKLEADIEFLENIISILRRSDDFFVISDERRQLRLDEAMTYFRFVHEYGLKSFVAGRDITISKVGILPQVITSAVLTWHSILIPFKLATQTVLVKLKMRNTERFCVNKR